MGDELIGQVLGLEGVPQLVFLGAGDAEDALAAFELERHGKGLGAGHAAGDPAGRRLEDLRGGGRGGRERCHALRRRELEEVAPRDGVAHRSLDGWPAACGLARRKICAGSLLSVVSADSGESLNPASAENLATWESAA